MDNLQIIVVHLWSVGKWMCHTQLEGWKEKYHQHLEVDMKDFDGIVVKTQKVIKKAASS